VSYFWLRSLADWYVGTVGKEVSEVGRVASCIETKGWGTNGSLRKCHEVKKTGRNEVLVPELVIHPRIRARLYEQCSTTFLI
jgi:hypothetical protein